MRSCMLVLIVLCIVWLRLKGGACSNLEAMSQNSPNHTTRTNKVRDPFCKRKWFGIHKWAGEHFSMPTFMSEGQISTARLDSPADNQIWCREVQRKYSPSADPLLSVVVHVYLLSNTKWVLLWRSQSWGCQPGSNPFSAFFSDADVFQSNDAAVLVETEAQMPRTYPSDAEACLSLSGKTLKDIKFRSLVQKEGKIDDLARTY